MQQRFLVFTALSGIILAAAPAQAQTQSAAPAASTKELSDKSQEIVVTSRRRAEPVQSVPIVIQTLSAQQLEDRGITNLRDIAAYTSGLVFDRGISLQDTRPIIRGLPATRGRPPVGVLLDGIDISTESLGNAGGGSLMNSRLLDLERVEVVKGPQSALYGRAAFAGAINYITKRPSSELQGEARASYSSFSTYELAASLSGPLADKFGFRVNFVRASSDGDYKNPVGGGNLNSYSNTGGSIGLQYDSGPKLKAYLRVAYSEDTYSQAAIQNLSGFVAGNVSRPAATTPEGQAVAIGFAGGALSSALTSNVPPRQTLTFTGVTGLSLDPRNGQDLPGSKSNTFTSTLNVTSDLGPVTLVYNAGYIRQNDRLIYDGDFFGKTPVAYTAGTAEPMNLFDYVDFSNKLDLINQEVRLQSLDGKPFRWAVGGLYWYSNMRQDSRSLRAISGFPLTGTPATAAGSGTGLFLASTLPVVPFQRTIDSYSGYGLVEYDITPKLTVSAEARYISETTFVVRSDFVQAAFAPIAASFVDPLQSASLNDDAVVPRFAITYKPSSDALIYASAAKGFKPGGVSELDFASKLTDSKFLSESVWNYEIGAKTQLADRQLTLNAAFFYMDYTNKQVSQLIEDATASGGFRASVRNAGAASVYGIDASVIIRPKSVPGLVWDFGATYLDTKYTNYTILSNSGFTVTEASNCTLITVGGKPICSVTYNGNRLERAPKFQFTSNLNYRHQIASDVTGTIGLSLQYQGSRFLSADNRLTLPSFVNVDMQVGLEFQQFTLQGFVTNLTNETAVRSAQENFDLSTFGRSVNIYAPPRRTFGVRAKARF